jgi:hypothetical protein
LKFRRLSNIKSRWQQTFWTGFHWQNLMKCPALTLLGIICWPGSYGRVWIMKLTCSSLLRKHLVNWQNFFGYVGIDCIILVKVCAALVAEVRQRTQYNISRGTSTSLVQARAVARRSAWYIRWHGSTAPFLR